MYTVLVAFDNITEVYQVEKYNDEVKNAIEYLNTYGGDSIEFVCEGEIVESVYQLYSIEYMINRFEKSEFFENYCDSSEKPMMENYKELLRKIAAK
ncbi:MULTISPECIES: hypothetical protein [Paenibacillus]|uniref:hypothetical protein n=1 Tax=Paenibacillus TaxID=44249 RepID=UPI0007ABA9E7|nr:MULTISPECIES: hypothetical protein [Paenibacillus]KZE65107.1 hypothetical protein AV545_04075 [Paenibacillus jamilae]